MKKNILIAVVVVVLLGLGAVVIGSGSDKTDNGMQNMDMSRMEPSSNQRSEPAAANTVIIDSLDFQQKEITVKKGDTVTWKNEDTARHNVVFDDESVGEVENSQLIGKGEELQFTFDKTGEFSYFCSPHPFMKAKIIVTE